MAARARAPRPAASGGDRGRADPETEALLRTRTSLPLLLAPTFRELTELYAELDAGVVLYCNNSMLNFQSLLDGRKLHVHINHGESDKQSMASNNAKAYDRVFVAGQAAVQRHEAGLLEFDTSRLVRIGRPQLDLRPPAVLAPTSAGRSSTRRPGRATRSTTTTRRSTPWASTSSGRCWPCPDVRAVYKPHPKVTTSPNPAIRAAHQAILAILGDAALRDPEAGHQAVTAGDILAVIPDCDAMITDVSSVGLDWLYLRTERPMFITDRHHDAERLRQDVPVSRCADVIDRVDVAELAALVGARLEHDEHHLARVAMRHHYFDDVQVGESTTRFIAEVGELVALRDRLVGANANDRDHAITA